MARTVNLFQKEASSRIRLIRARHEKDIHAVLRAWSRPAPIGTHGLRKLTCEQQRQLRKMVAKMFVEVAKTEGYVRLDVCASPEEFESDLDRVIEKNVHKAQARWRELTARYQFEGEPAVNREADIAEFVRSEFTPIAEDLNYEAWAKDAKRLEAECGLAAERWVRQLPDVPRAQPQAGTEERLGQRIDELRRNQGLTIDAS